MICILYQKLCLNIIVHKSYRLRLQISSEEDRQNFIEDYRITACISILQWFCMEYKKHGVAGVEGGPEGPGRTQVKENKCFKNV